MGAQNFLKLFFSIEAIHFFRLFHFEWIVHYMLSFELGIFYYDYKKTLAEVLNNLYTAKPVLDIKCESYNFETKKLIINKKEFNYSYWRNISAPFILDPIRSKDKYFLKLSIDYTIKFADELTKSDYSNHLNQLYNECGEFNNCKISENLNFKENIIVAISNGNKYYEYFYLLLICTPYIKYYESYIERKCIEKSISITNIISKSNDLSLNENLINSYKIKHLEFGDETYINSCNRENYFKIRNDIDLKDMFRIFVICIRIYLYIWCRYNLVIEYIRLYLQNVIHTPDNQLWQWFFVYLLYIFNIVIELNSNFYKFFKTIPSIPLIKDYIENMESLKPNVDLVIECYHYDDEVSKSKKIVTFKKIDNFDYPSFNNSSKNIKLLNETPKLFYNYFRNEFLDNYFVNLNSSIKVVYDENTTREINKLKRNLILKYKRFDKYIEVNENLNTPDQSKHNLICNATKINVFYNSNLYLLLIFLQPLSIFYKFIIQGLIRGDMEFELTKTIISHDDPQKDVISEEYFKSNDSNNLIRNFKFNKADNIDPLIPSNMQNYQPLETIYNKENNLNSENHIAYKINSKVVQSKSNIQQVNNSYNLPEILNYQNRENNEFSLINEIIQEKYNRSEMIIKENDDVVKHNSDNYKYITLVNDNQQSNKTKHSEHFRYDTNKNNEYDPLIKKIKKE